MIWLDEDVLPLARILAGLRDDVAHPPGPPEPSWLVITRDRRIEDHRARIADVLERRRKLVVLTGLDAGGTWGQLEVVLTQWRAIQALSQQDGPFIRAATRSGLRPVPLRA